VDLSGQWRANVADDERRRSAVGLDYPDGDWPEVEVPGHWRNLAPFADNDDSLIYRKRFDLEAAPTGRRHFVTLDGIFYQADVWLDGAYLGDPEGYFFPHTFDITSLSRLASEHVLAIEVACPPERNRESKRAITGVMQNWNAMDPTWNPGGILATGAGSKRPGRCGSTGGAVLCDVNDTRAHLRLHARLDSDVAGLYECARASTASCSTSTSNRSQAGSTKSTGTSTSTIRGCGGHGRSASKS
jgi:beta-mannosidase